MIVSNFLPTDTVLSEITDPVQLTNNLYTLNLNYPDGWPDAYWLGWLRWENTPDMLKLSDITIDYNSSPGNKWQITCAQGNPVNMNVGYVSQGRQAYNVDYWMPQQICAFTDNSGVYHDPESHVSPRCGTRFINSLDPRAISTLDGYNVTDSFSRKDDFSRINIFVCPMTGIYSDVNPIWLDLHDEPMGIEKFLRGELTKSISISGYCRDTNGNPIYSKGYDINYTFDINSADYGTEYPNVWTITQTQGGNTFKIHMFMVGFSEPKHKDFKNDETVYDFGTYGITPAFSQNYDGNTYYSASAMQQVCYIRFEKDAGSNPPTHHIAYTTDRFYSDINEHSLPVISDMTLQTGVAYGGFNCDINIYDTSHNLQINFSGNCAIFPENQAGRYTSTYVIRILSPAEIMHALTLNMRCVARENSAYGFGANIYVPHISPDNEFLCEWLTGDFAAIEQDLRPWQYGDITENEYNPEDLPPYYPPADEGENVGDKITRPATLGAGGTLGFITQYALRAADVTELGGLLWTSIFTSDYWKNYMFSLALDTGSLDLASILNFFISLRVYPFPLVNVPSYAQFGQDMYIGTGIMPLHFANNLHTINNYCDYVPGGSAVVDSGNFYHDWRDYINTEIILYIPYCGTVQLNPGDVVGNTVSVQYAVDFATGGCIAYVDLETGDGAGYPIAALPGQMGADIPLTATAAGQVAARLAGDAMNVAHLIGGQFENEIGVATGAAKGSYHPSLGSIGAAVGGPIGAAAGFGASLVPGLAGQAVNMLSRGAVSAPMLGGARGFASFGAPQTPYIQIRRGIYPDFGVDIMGNATAGVYTVGDLSGFVSGEIKTDSLTCSDYEKSLIKQLISQGIYV